MMCPIFLLFDLVGAFCERPRANTVRPYESSKSLVNQNLFACFLDRYGYSYRHTNHGVVTCGNAEISLWGFIDFWAFYDII